MLAGRQKCVFHPMNSEQAGPYFKTFRSSISSSGFFDILTFLTVFAVRINDGFLWHSELEKYA